MVGSRVMLTPNGLEVSLRVSRMASRSAEGLGWVKAVRIPIPQENILSKHIFVGLDCERTETTGFRNGCCKPGDTHPNRLFSIPQNEG